MVEPGIQAIAPPLPPMPPAPLPPEPAAPPAPLPLEPAAPPAPLQSQGPSAEPSGVQTCTPCPPPGHAQATCAPGVHTCIPELLELELDGWPNTGSSGMHEQTQAST